MPKKDYQLHWKDWKGTHSEHRVRIFDGTGEATGKTIVLVSENPDARGVSVTNGCQEIVAIVCQEQNLDPQSIIFIEHYEREKLSLLMKSWQNEEDFALVNFTWSGREQKLQQPTWQHTTRHYVEQICGEKI